MRRNNIIKWGGMVLAAAVLATGVWSVNQETDEITIPQTVKFIDTEDGSVIVEEEEVPLASKPTVKVKTTTKKSVKKNKLKKKAKKTKKTTKKTTTKRTIKKENSKQKVKTETTVKTTVQTQTKKKSQIQTVTTTVKTTVKTTTTNKPVTTNTASASTTNTVTTTAAAASSSSSSASSSASSSSASSSSAAASSSSASSSSSSTVSTILMRNLATAADANVLAAYELMGFTTEINPSKTYSGYFNSVDHKIILQSKKASTAYHELGHFVGWLAGNVDTKSEFVAIYNSEKDQVTSSNKAYVTKSSSEYFAECYKMYVMEPGTLKANMPQTYAYIQEAVAKITTARAKSIKEYYDAVYWK